jgi:plasmid stability protein
MSKMTTTLTIDERIWRAVRVRAARPGRGISDVVEAALRKDLGVDLVDRLWDRNDLTEDEAMALALEAQAAVRDQGDT